MAEASPITDPRERPLTYDETDLAFQRDPYPVYRALRERSPVYLEHTPDGVPIWRLFRHVDGVAVLRSERFEGVKVPMPPGDAVPDGLRPIVELFGDMMLTRDPPDHTRLRNLVSKAFTPRRIERLRRKVQSQMDERLEAAIGRGSLDLVRDIAVPLPVVVIAELLGLPVEDRARLKHWSDDIAPMLDGSLREAALPRIVTAAIELCEYLSTILEQRRSAPRDDLLSALLAAQEADDRLTDREILATSILILGAGHETTTNLIGNGMRALLAHPAELARLRADPALVGSAVEEMLRYDAPVQMTSRRPLDDLEIRGVRIPAGEEVNVMIGSANRDPEVFRDPDRFDIGRSPGRHLSFGQGTHFCLGASLARLEAAVTVSTLIERLPGLAAAAGEPRRRPGIVLRGLESLPVSW